MAASWIDKHSCRFREAIPNGSNLWIIFKTRSIKSWSVAQRAGNFFARYLEVPVLIQVPDKIFPDLELQRVERLNAQLLEQAFF